MISSVSVYLSAPVAVWIVLEEMEAVQKSWRTLFVRFAPPEPEPEVERSVLE